MEEKGVTIEIKNLEIIILLAFLGFMLFLELQVTLNRPLVFGDEGTHARYSQWIAEELEYPIWTPFGDTPLEKRSFSRPPLWNFLGASFMFFLGNNEVILKILVPFTGTIVLGLAVFVLTKRIYNTKTALFASIITVTIPAIVTHAVLNYTDILATLYFLMATLTLILAMRSDKKKYWITSGIFSGLAFLTKSTAFILFPIIALCFLYQLYKNKSIKIFKKYLLWGVIVLIFIIPFFVRGYVHYNYPSCNLPIIPFLSTEGCRVYLMPEQQYEFEGVTEQTGTEQSIFRIGVMSYLTFAYGNVWFVVFALLGGLSIFVWRRKTSDLVLVIVLSSLFLILYRDWESRAENISRYLLGWAPIIGVVAGNYFNQIYKFIEKYQKYVALVVIMIVIYYSYLNISEKLNVMLQVKQFSPSFLEACDWIKENTDKDIRLGSVIWAGAAIYNCQRNIGGGGADVTFSNDVGIAIPLLKMQEITHIFIQKFSISYTNQKFSERYPISFIDFLENNPEYFEKVYKNGPSIDECKLAGGCDGTILYKINYNTPLPS